LKIAVGEGKFVEIHVGVVCAVLLLITLENCKHLAVWWTKAEGRAEKEV
jgi:hypothetical protein